MQDVTYAQHSSTVQCTMPTPTPLPTHSSPPTPTYPPTHPPPFFTHTSLLHKKSHTAGEKATRQTLGEHQLKQGHPLPRPLLPPLPRLLHVSNCPHRPCAWERRPGLRVLPRPCCRLTWRARGSGVRGVRGGWVHGRSGVGVAGAYCVVMGGWSVCAPCLRAACM